MKFPGSGCKEEAWEGEIQGERSLEKGGASGRRQVLGNEVLVKAGA